MIRGWPSKERMADILRAAGLRVTVGQFSVRIQDQAHFVFQQYGGDLGEPSIEADADSVEELHRLGRLVSDSLAKAGIIHRFEIYDEQDRFVEVLHFNWPPVQQ